jgi:hypothetical protein
MVVVMRCQLTSVLAGWCNTDGDQEETCRLIPLLPAQLATTERFNLLAGRIRCVNMDIPFGRYLYQNQPRLSR